MSNIHVTDISVLADNEKVSVYCRAENRILGIIYGKKNELLSPKLCDNNWLAKSKHKPVFISREITVCPRCGEPLKLLDVTEGDNRKRHKKAIFLIPNEVRFV